MSTFILAIAFIKFGSAVIRLTTLPNNVGAGSSFSSSSDFAGGNVCSTRFSPTCLTGDVKVESKTVPNCFSESGCMRPEIVDPAVIDGLDSLADDRFGRRRLLRAPRIAIGQSTTKYPHAIASNAIRFIVILPGMRGYVITATAVSS